MNKKTFLILTPVYNDFESVKKLIVKINQIVSLHKKKVIIIIINDGSQEINFSIKSKDYKAIKKIELINLKRNLGHQCAIAIGLSYIAQEYNSYDTVVMDSDGEDKPEDIFKLVKAHSKNKKAIVFAHRFKRTESRLFKAFYKIYKFFFRLLTGKKIFFGNFSLVPSTQIKKVILTSDIWWHYAASILNSRLEIITVPTKRGYRLAGKSKMNFNSLILHGLRAFAVFSEKIALRFLLGSLLLGIAIFIILFIIILIKLFTKLAIPGWTSTLSVLLIITLLQILLISFISFFTVLNTRDINSMSFNDKLKNFIKEKEIY